MTRNSPDWQAQPSLLKVPSRHGGIGVKEDAGRRVRNGTLWNLQLGEGREGREGRREGREGREGRREGREGRRKRKGEGGVINMDTSAIKSTHR